MQENGQIVDYRALQKSSLFSEYKNLASQLHFVDLLKLNEAQRTAFCISERTLSVLAWIPIYLVFSRCRYLQCLNDSRACVTRLSSKHHARPAAVLEIELVQNRRTCVFAGRPRAWNPKRYMRVVDLYYSCCKRYSVLFFYV